MEKEITYANELQFQADCFLWIQNEMRHLRGLVRRVKNETDHIGGSSRSRIAQGVENRTTGVVAGTWDVFLVTAPITWIEFKMPRGVLSDAQEDFMNMGLLCGWQFEIVKTKARFKQVINHYYG